jgi:hypothetical protein
MTRSALARARSRPNATSPTATTSRRAAPGLSAETLGRVANLGASLGLDIYVDDLAPDLNVNPPQGEARSQPDK